MNYGFFVSLIICAALPPAVAVAVVEHPHSFHDLWERADVFVAIAFSFDAVRQLIVISSSTHLTYPGTALAGLTYCTLVGMAIAFWGRVAQIAKSKNKGVTHENQS